MPSATMHALVLTAPGVVENQEVPVPSRPEGDQALLRVTRAGVCGSELEAIHTKSPRRVPPLIMGHEFAGRIEALGPDAAAAGWKVGDRVVPNPLVPCGRCRACARGLTNACPNRTLDGLHHHGGHAEWALVRAAQLHRLPDSMTDEAAAAAEPVAVAIHAVRLLQGVAVMPEAVLIFGAGTIGLLVLQSVRLAGAAQAVVLDVDPHRLEVARRLGATHTLDPRTPEGGAAALADLGMQLTGFGFDAALDCVGRSDVRAAALQAVSPGGVVVWVGQAEEVVTVNGGDLLRAERRIQGSYGYTGEDFAKAVAALASGRIDTTSWSQTYPLSTSAGLIGRLLEHKEPCIKALLDPAA
ncbi:MAG TPA: alcohol dehydrogenase catalytic domain-containing protein [Chloroflexota bacterium]|nr:alcohol dehydrogenase catalytic domain-containing protein [Chloroflexota bacterium]